MTVIDYSSWRPPTATWLHDAGVTDVIRYLARDNHATHGKIIFKDEYDNLLAQGVSVALVWEQSGDSWQRGYSGGLADGAEAVRQAQELGHTGTIFAAFDGNIFPAMLPVAVAYQRGFNDGAGRKMSAYSTKYVLDNLRALDLIEFGWQTNARGWFKNAEDDPRASLYQRYNWQIPGFPGTYDVNTVNLPDWGQVPSPTDDPTPTPEPLPEGFKPVLIMTTKAGGSHVISENLERVDLVSKDTVAGMKQAGVPEAHDVDAEDVLRFRDATVHPES